MEVLGHARMRATTDTYSQVMPALGRDAADRMGVHCGSEPASDTLQVATTPAP
jgi:integrase